MSVGLQARPPVDTPVSTAAPLNTIHLSRTLAADALQRFGTLPLRLFLGLTFIYAALVKIADPGYLDPTAGGAYLGNQLQGFVASSPIGFLIEAVALPQIQLVGISVVLTELVVGLLVVGGVFTRFAAAVGALLNLQLFLTLTWNIQPYFLAPDSLSRWPGLRLRWSAIVNCSVCSLFYGRADRATQHASTPEAFSVAGKPSFWRSALLPSV
jgi:uncharacterized membrane protein YphA (DoxX/SURF4 family)